MAPSTRRSTRQTSPRKATTRSSSQRKQENDTASPSTKEPPSPTLKTPTVKRVYGKARFQLRPLPSQQLSKPPSPISTEKPSEARESENISDDELLLSPPKPQRMKTPAGVMRMEAVEILSPRGGFTKRESDTPLVQKIQALDISAQDAPDSDTVMSTPHRKKRRKIDDDILPTPKKTRGSRSPRKAKGKGKSSLEIIPPEIEPATLDQLEGPPNPDFHETHSEQTFISIDELPPLLPDRFHSCLRAQKLQILRALRNPSVDTLSDSDDDSCTNNIASTQLKNLLDGTLSRGEGNSCLLMGPRGSGKSRIVEQQLDALSEKPIILRLSGWVQRTDRLALREIAYQLTQQTGSSFLMDEEEETGAANDDDENPFLVPAEPHTPPGVALPPASHLPALIGMLPTLSRPSIVILDAFDLFALHPRQSLLYCLLDTAQSCRAGAGSKGTTVIGMTSRIDANNMLEKRVKSRFSGRIYRTAPPAKLYQWLKVAKAALSVETQTSDQNTAEWRTLWVAAIHRLFEDETVQNLFKEAYSVIRDIRLLCRILTSLVIQLSPASPFPTSQLLISAISTQRTRPQLTSLHQLSYPSLCLLIASVYAIRAGHTSFTFEMLHESFQDQVRASQAAPVQVQGSSIGMVRCTREVLMSAFEELVSTHIFVPTAAPSSNTAKEFVKYRCIAEIEDIRKVVDRDGQVNLRKWFTKAQ